MNEKLNIPQIEQWAAGLLTVALVAEEGEESNIYACLHHLFCAVKMYDNLSVEERKKADIVRQIMIKVGRSDADKELDLWIDGKEQSITAQAIQKQTEALLKVAERPANSYNYAAGAVHDDKRSQLVFGEEKLVPLKQLSHE